VFSYILDDPYIHLAIAKNLVSHGVWGVTPFEFASASSSLLWTGLLAAWIKLFGNGEFAPLWLNLALAAFLLGQAEQSMRSSDWPPERRFVVLSAMVIGIPLPALIFTGQEHTAHVVAALGFLSAFATHLRHPQPTIRETLALTFWGALICLARYESLFGVYLAALFLVTRRRFGAAGSLIAGAALLPALFGLYSLAQGGFLLPNSVLLKGNNHDLASSAGRWWFFGGKILDSFREAPELLFLLMLGFWSGLWGSESATDTLMVSASVSDPGSAGVGGVTQSASSAARTVVLPTDSKADKAAALPTGSSANITVAFPTDSTTDNTAALPTDSSADVTVALPTVSSANSIVALPPIMTADTTVASSIYSPGSDRTLIWWFAGCVLFHLQFAKIGNFFRYEAYLVALGLCLAAHLPKPAPGRTLRNLVFALLVLGTTLSLGQRGYRGISLIPTAAGNIFQQQHQMARFVNRYYPGQGIVLNDIGAVSFFADIHLLDLVGLGDIRVAQAMRAGRHRFPAIADMAAARGMKLAIAYPGFLRGLGGPPPEWFLVAEWEIPDNVICSEAVVALYALNAAEREPLRARLREFAATLPASVSYRLY
jgi:hypothetical protein